MEDRSEEDCAQENGQSDGTNSKPSGSPCTSLRMFLVALSFAYFAKALSGSYMKSTITQLERRFDIPSYLIGVIDGSFEIGEFSLSDDLTPPSNFPISKGIVQSSSPSNGSGLHLNLKDLTKQIY
ncbi:hypothetical protein ILYODFUR_021504 [Ilyodon furcidens]|uniref:Uncharacterized protein n=1 Tax=Ilyodon furcidens TaxID=33524 RepID=A0ABV0TWJ1_9TELE